MLVPMFALKTPVATEVAVVSPCERFLTAVRHALSTALDSLAFVTYRMPVSIARPVKSATTVNKAENAIISWPSSRFRSPRSPHRTTSSVVSHAV